MKIHVLSKERMSNLVGRYGIKSDCFYITIKCPIETDYAVQENLENILKLDFNDSTWPETGLVLFNRKMADKILGFFNRILEQKTSESILYVNCGAGISRSGAIGEAANIFFNRVKEENNEDYYRFYEENSQIQPNILVKEILLKKIC